MKRVLIVSDLHVGSTSGLLGDEVTIEPEHGGRCQRIMPNAIQAELYAQWRQMIRDVGTVDLVICNGDLVDGDNHHSGGLGAWSTNIGLQAETAAELLDEVRTSRYVVIQGSPYHTSINMSGDEAVCRFLDGAEWKGIQTMLDIEGVRVHVRHKIGHSSVPYGRHTAPSKDGVVMQLNQDVYGKVDIKVLSHTHKFGYDGTERILNIVTPCWKWNDDFISAGSSDLPTLGYITIDVTGNTYSWASHIFRLGQTQTLQAVCVG